MSVAVAEASSRVSVETKDKPSPTTEINDKEMNGSKPNGAGTSVTDNDENDNDSYSTVLSEQSSSSEEEEEEDDDSLTSSCDLLKLEKEFKARDKALKRLTRGVDPAYARVMRDNEYAARRQMLARCESKNNDSTIPAGNDTTFFVGIIKRIRMFTAFDLRNTMSGATHLILYCIAHPSCFQTVEAAIVALTKRFPNQDSVAIFLVVGSIVVLRVTGGMWDYLEPDTYERVKFDMHNRLRLNKMDARVTLWFRRHAGIRDFFSLLTFYVSLEALGWLHWRLIEIISTKLVPAVVDAIRIQKQQVLNAETCPVDGVCDIEDEAMATEISYTWYYVISAVLAIGLLRVLGHPFLGH